MDAKDVNVSIPYEQKLNDYGNFDVTFLVPANPTALDRDIYVTVYLALLYGIDNALHVYKFTQAGY